MVDWSPFSIASNLHSTDKGSSSKSTSGTAEEKPTKHVRVEDKPAPTPQTKYETKQEDPKRRIVTMEPSVQTFAGTSSNRRDRSDNVMITDALSDVRVKWVLSIRLPLLLCTGTGMRDRMDIRLADIALSHLTLLVRLRLIVDEFTAPILWRYHINPKELGHGHYGVVRKCMDRGSKEWYAIKSIRKAKVSKIEVLKREIEILKEVKHPNIIELIDVFEAGATNK